MGRVVFPSPPTPQTKQHHLGCQRTWSAGCPHLIRYQTDGMQPAPWHSRSQRDSGLSRLFRLEISQPSRHNTRCDSPNSLAMSVRLKMIERGQRPHTVKRLVAEGQCERIRATRWSPTAWVRCNTTSVMSIPTTQATHGEGAGTSPLDTDSSNKSVFNHRPPTLRGNQRVICAELIASQCGRHNRSRACC